MLTHLPGSRRLFLLAIALVSVSTSFAQGWDTVSVKLTKLTPTVYMMEGRGGNIGLCVGGDGTFIIDDQFAPLSDKIIKAIGTVTGKPVQFVINTHFHGDHAGGNTNFGNKGAIIVSQENTRKRLEADSFFKAQAANNPAISPAGLPKITFAESMEFHYNKETVKIFHIADAHTDGDAIIWFKESNVLHMGDVFVRYGLPYIDMPNGGNINGMIETINYVIGQIDDKTIIIPGHGQLSNKQDLVTYNTMLTTIRDRVKKLMDAGKSYDDIIKAKPISDIEKSVANANSFIKVVYDSQPKNEQAPSIKYGDNKDAGNFKKINGIDLYYETYGAGKPMLILHGNGGSIRNYGGKIEFFKNHFKVIAIDSRGHGKSIDTTSKLLTYVQMADDVKVLLDSLHVDSAFVFGQSDGGIVGLLLAIKYPAKIAKLATYGANIFPGKNAIFSEIDDAVQDSAKATTNFYKRRLFSLMAYQPDIKVEDLQKIKCPVLIMSGDRDAIRLEHSIKIFDNIKNSNLFIMPGATHFGTVEKPALYNMVIMDFFNKPFSKVSTVDLFFPKH